MLSKYGHFRAFFFRTFFFDFFNFKRTALKLKLYREHKYISYPYQFHVNRISLRSLKARSKAIFKRCAWFDSFISNLGNFQVMNDLGASRGPLIERHLESVNDGMGSNQEPRETCKRRIQIVFP